MQVETQSLFGGSLSWGRITQKEAAHEAEVDESTLSKVKQGKEGFGPVAAKKLSPIAGVEAAELYIASQVHSATKRRDAGEIDDATTLRIVGRVVGTLKQHFPNAKISDEHAKALQDLAAAASKSGATPANQMEALGRDGAGRKVKKSGTTTATKSTGQEGRDGAGRKVQKRYGG